MSPVRLAISRRAGAWQMRSELCVDLAKTTQQQQQKVEQQFRQQFEQQKKRKKKQKQKQLETD